LHTQQLLLANADSLLVAVHSPDQLSSYSGIYLNLPALQHLDFSV